MPEVTLLPTPLSPRSVSLGQLLADPFDPLVESFLIDHSPQLRKPSVQRNFQDRVLHDDEHRLTCGLCRSSRSSSDNLVHVEAEQSSHHSIFHPASAFANLQAYTSAQAFLHKAATRNQPLYYVTAIQTLKNPTFHRVGTSSPTSAKQEGAPQLRLPTHVRRDSTMDFDERGKGNELVYAMELRKVKAVIGSNEQPHAVEDIHYVWSYYQLENGLQLAIGFGKALDPAELRALAGIEDEMDYTDRSWDSENEDEGIGGF